MNFRTEMTIEMVTFCETSEDMKFVYAETDTACYNECGGMWLYFGVTGMIMKLDFIVTTADTIEEFCAATDEDAATPIVNNELFIAAIRGRK